MKMVHMQGLTGRGGGERSLPSVSRGGSGGGRAGSLNIRDSGSSSLTCIGREPTIIV